MALISLLITMTLTLSAASFAGDFKVALYTLKHTDGHLILNFQLNEDRKLEILDDDIANPIHLFKKNQHHQVMLKASSCGLTKDLRIKDATTGAVLFTKDFPSADCEQYSFGFISDTRDSTQRHKDIAKVISYHHSLEPLQFIINSGDIVQSGDKESEWIEYFKGGSAYLSDIPQIVAIGNHDYQLNSRNQLPKYFQQFMRWEKSPANGNLLFHMPGFQLIIWNSNTPKLSRSLEKEMMVWLEEKMKAARDSNTPLILATHHPLYSSSINRFVSFPVIKLRKRLRPLAEKYNVKLILSGHTHMYERSFNNGVHYVVAGPAGANQGRATFRNKYRQKFDPSASTFTKVKYQNRTFKLETFNQDNTLIDQLFINL